MKDFVFRFTCLCMLTKIRCIRKKLSWFEAVDLLIEFTSR